MQVLVSVSSVQEAELALSAGVRLIDLKETSYGALAALDLDVSQSIIDAVNRYRQQHPDSAITVSATIGDDCASVPAFLQLSGTRCNMGVDVIKLPETIWGQENFQTGITLLLSSHCRLIAVLSPPSLAEKDRLQGILHDLARRGYWGVMVDTTEKSQPLTALLALDALVYFVGMARSLNLYVGMAGGLRMAQFEQLAAIAPDYLGFRSGLCANQRREQPLIPEKVHLLVEKLSQIC
ncbi:Uncharacterized protein, UPF0264 family [Methylophilus rhizosphaerae]|uniref:(5-formylfuran-3-yl)methyl phosphate synthase n=1 Tax=Methylophilus rhizosphaerae TaxID=492660 RepID=A0A1G9AZT3_9PROT|nr:(5-formylfuran-3-yl)methyl phosphate synthase [Methylophilus rhizosphaerae]SDK32782.1 Uncharacterized protein, UPF0264 family [Methylophilus rhizosphaerae]